MAKAETTEVAKKDENTAVALSLSFEQDESGFEDMGQDDLALPFLRILTNMSPEIGEVDGASPGMIYNSVTGELFDGKAGIQVIPCAYVRQYIEWAPRGQGSGGPVNIFPATSDVLSRTHREPGDNKDYLDNGNYIENSAQHFVMMIDQHGVPSPALIVMKSTQLKKSRKWNSMMASRSMQGANGPFTPPRFSHIYHLKTVQEENSKGSWHGWEMSVEGVIDDGTLYTRAKGFAESITAGDVVVKHTDDEGTAGNVPF